MAALNVLPLALALGVLTSPRPGVEVVASAPRCPTAALDVAELRRLLDLERPSLEGVRAVRLVSLRCTPPPMRLGVHVIGPGDAAGTTEIDVVSASVEVQRRQIVSAVTLAAERGRLAIEARSAARPLPELRALGLARSDGSIPLGGVGVDVSLAVLAHVRLGFGARYALGRTSLDAGDVAMDLLTGVVVVHLEQPVGGFDLFAGPRLEVGYGWARGSAPATGIEPRAGGGGVASVAVELGAAWRFAPGWRLVGAIDAGGMLAGLEARAGDEAVSLEGFAFGTALGLAWRGGAPSAE